MGCVLSAHTFYHPDLLAAFTYDTTFKKWYRHPDNINDPGWVRNSPLRNELVDLLNDATEARGFAMWVTHWKAIMDWSLDWAQTPLSNPTQTLRPRRH